MDRVLNFPAEQYSLPLRQRVAEQARSLAMNPTVEAIDRTTGAHVPKRQAEQLVLRASQDFDAFYAQRMQPANDTLSKKDLLVMTSDSKGIAMVPNGLRPATRAKADAAKAKRPKHADPMRSKAPRTHNKRMALVTAVYEIEPHVRTATEVTAGFSRKAGSVSSKQIPKPKNKTVTATVEKNQKAGILAMFQEAARRDPEQKRQAVALVDGELRQIESIKLEAKARGWRITVILDLIHVLHYVWAAAKALCLKGKRSAEKLANQCLLMLLEGKSSQVAKALLTLASERRVSVNARGPVGKCVGYLRKYAKYLRYDRFLAAGYPIATGVIEGACRHLVQDRMGITGARWDVPGAEAVLRLRALWTNGDWDVYWAFHEAQEARRNAAKLAA